MTRFHNITVKTYSQKSLNIIKGVVRIKELSLCTIEEIKSEMRKQGVTEVKSVYQKRGENIRNEHLHNDIRPAQNTGEDKNRLYSGEGQAIHTQSIAML